ncbi:MAG: hypothetical protein J0H01_37505 [Rhizobiales bacterium]|nr:hypothetical protein [Hyphomicrobiales bacterium]
MNTYSLPIANIPNAAKRANCSAREIVQSVLDRKLDWVGRDSNVWGYLGILVNVEEIRGLVRGTFEGCMAVETARKKLGTTHRCIRALVDHGMLPTRTAISPLNRCPINVIDQVDFDRFTAEFVSLFTLALEIGENPQRLSIALRQRGVRPALAPDRYHVTFYRQNELEL